MYYYFFQLEYYQLYCQAYTFLYQLLHSFLLMFTPYFVVVFFYRMFNRWLDLTVLLDCGILLADWLLEPSILAELLFKLEATDGKLVNFFCVYRMFNRCIGLTVLLDCGILLSNEPSSESPLSSESIIPSWFFFLL